MRRLLEAAMWAPFHGPVPPWRFVVLGRHAMIAMQQMTLAYYDTHWRSHVWSSETDEDDDDDTEDLEKSRERREAASYQRWRMKREEEITGRWGPVSYMVGIVMQRQAGSKRMNEWEEAAATACAVQNMHLQASVDPTLACYWSSWHDAARDSEEMRQFLGMGREDKCLGFFMVASCRPDLKDLRQRKVATHLKVEWRE